MLRARFPLRLSAAVLFSELRAFPSCVLLLLNVHSLFSFMWKQFLEIFASSPKFKATFTMNVSWNFSFFTLFHHSVLDVAPWSPSFFFPQLFWKESDSKVINRENTRFYVCLCNRKGSWSCCSSFVCFRKNCKKHELLAKKKKKLHLISYKNLKFEVLWTWMWYGFTWSATVLTAELIDIITFVEYSRIIMALQLFFYVYVVGVDNWDSM